MRPISRKYDEHEHEHAAGSVVNMMLATRGRQERRSTLDGGPGRRHGAASCVQTEELSLGRRRPLPAHPQSPASAAPRSRPPARRSRSERFLSRVPATASRSGARWRSPSPAPARDSAAIQTTAARDGDEWVLNGTKIFCTSGDGALEVADGFVVVWATVDKTAGRGGIKAFVVGRARPA